MISHLRFEMPVFLSRVDYLAGFNMGLGSSYDLKGDTLNWRFPLVPTVLSPCPFFIVSLRNEQ